MRLFIILYWCIGCVLMGLAFGRTMNQCPGEKWVSTDIVAAIVIWPALIVAATHIKDAQHTCAAGPNP